MKQDVPQGWKSEIDGAESKDLRIHYQSPFMLKPHPQNARTHSKKQIRQIAASVKQFGFNNPIIVDSENRIIAGHGRKRAAEFLSMDRVPTVRVEHLTPDEIRAYILADNRVAELAGWDGSILAIELQSLLEVEDFDVNVTGFEVAEIDLIIQEALTKKEEESEVIDVPAGPAVNRSGDLWTLGKHKVICGSALEESTFVALMARRKADVVLTDPPYNVPVEGNVCGKGTIHHREFAMASGEMKPDEFVNFLTTSLGLAARFSSNGAVVFVFMDWRHMG